jgi:hypothetical protein
VNQRRQFIPPTSPLEARRRGICKCMSAVAIKNKQLLAMLAAQAMPLTASGACVCMPTCNS